MIVADGCGGSTTGGGVDVLTAATCVGVRLPVALGNNVGLAVLLGSGVKLGARVGVAVAVTPACGVLLAGLELASGVTLFSIVAVDVFTVGIDAAV
jgi:hypothetical protein